MITSFALSQIFAGLAFLLGISAYQFKGRKLMLILLTLTQCCASVHFFLLDATVASLVFLVSAMRYFVTIWTTKEFLKYLFILAAVVLGALTFSELYDIIPIISGIFGTCGAFCVYEKHMRQFFLSGSFLNLIYNIILVSPVAIGSSLFFLGSSLLGYWRFYVKK